MDLVTCVYIIAQILTYASFLAGAKVCHTIYKQGSCKQFSSIPFMVGLACTLLWLTYARITNSTGIILLNLVGVICQVFYLTFFVIYAGKQRPLIQKQLFSLAIAILLLVCLIHRSEDPKFLSGSLASMSSILACASPLVTIKEVLKTKCVVSMPFPMIISSFVVSFSWFIFGLLIQDKFIILSNVVALTINSTQLSLFAIYPRNLASKQRKPRKINLNKGTVKNLQKRIQRIKLSENGTQNRLNAKNK